MAWFGNLIRFSTTKSASSSSITTKPLILNTLFSHFTTDASLHNHSHSSPPPTQFAGLGPTKHNEKPRIVVLGSGWAGCRLMKGIDTKLYDVVCVSPRNHMVFTPLLASTCVGTLEFRSVAEPIARIQPAISKEPGSYFFLANCTGLDTHNHLVMLLFYLKFSFLLLQAFVKVCSCICELIRLGFIIDFASCFDPSFL